MLLAIYLLVFLIGNTDNLDVRLVNDLISEQPSDGTLQVKYMDVWTNVEFKNSLGINETNVICRQLGLSTHQSQMYKVDPIEGQCHFYTQTISYVECDGSETNVGHCRFSVTETPLLDKESSVGKTPVTYLVCGGTPNQVPTLTFVDMTMENGLVHLPANKEVQIVCETAPSIPLRKLHWQMNSTHMHLGIGSNPTRNVSMTNIIEISQNASFVTKSQMTFLANLGDVRYLVTYMRCGSEDYLNEQTLYSAWRTVRIGWLSETVHIQVSETDDGYSTFTLFGQCRAWGFPTVHVEWFVNGEPYLDNRESYSSEIQTVYTTSTISYRFSELNCTLLKFRCKATNIASPVPVWSKEVILNVKVPVKEVRVTAQPSESTISCVSSPCYPPANITWYVNKKALDDKAVGATTNESYGHLFVTRSELNTSAFDDAMEEIVVKCSAINIESVQSVESTEVIFRLNGTVRDVFLSISQTENTVTCRSSPCNPPAELTWYLNDSAVENGNISHTSLLVYGNLFETRSVLNISKLQTGNQELKIQCAGKNLPTLPAVLSTVVVIPTGISDQTKQVDVSTASSDSTLFVATTASLGSIAVLMTVCLIIMRARRLSKSKHSSGPQLAPGTDQTAVGYQELRFDTLPGDRTNR